AEVLLAQAVDVGALRRRRGRWARWLGLVGLGGGAVGPRRAGAGAGGCGGGAGRRAGRDRGGGGRGGRGLRRGGRGRRPRDRGAGAGAAGWGGFLAAGFLGRTGWAGAAITSAGIRIDATTAQRRASRGRRARTCVWIRLPARGTLAVRKFRSLLRCGPELIG